MTDDLPQPLKQQSSSPSTATRPRTPLLLVHGWWGGAWVWEPFLEAFDRHGFDCHAIDLKGANEEISADQLGRLTVQDHVDQIGRELERLTNPVLIGHSFGGLLIQKVLESHPAAAAVLLGPAAPRGILALRSWALLRNAIGLAPRMLLRQPFKPSRAAMIELNLNQVPAEDRDEILSQMVPASGLQGLQTAVFGVPVDPERIQTPMLVISGQHDLLTPPAIGRAIARKYKAEFRLYPDHAHYFMREPDALQIVTDISQWIDQQLPAIRQ